MHPNRAGSRALSITMLGFTGPSSLIHLSFCPSHHHPLVLISLRTGQELCRVSADLCSSRGHDRGPVHADIHTGTAVLETYCTAWPSQAITLLEITSVDTAVCTRTRADLCPVSGSPHSCSTVLVHKLTMEGLEVGNDMLDLLLLRTHMLVSSKSTWKNRLLALNALHHKSLHS